MAIASNRATVTADDIAMAMTGSASETNIYDGDLIT